MLKLELHFFNIAWNKKRPSKLKDQIDGGYRGLVKM